MDKEDKSIISSDIDKAVVLLNRGEVVAIPTETVYGLAGNIYNEDAINKIFTTKQRPKFNPLIVHIHSLDQVDEIATDFPPLAKKLAEKFWPGSLTLVLNKSEKIPDLITAGKPSVAIRMPNHPVTQKLLKSLSFPLAAPSANPFNRISPTKAEHVEEYFKNNIKMVLQGGECKNGLESTIVGFESGEPILFRLGAIAKEEIEEITGPLKFIIKENNAPAAPGMLDKHYSPLTPTVLVDNAKEYLSDKKSLSIGVITLNKDLSEIDSVVSRVLSPSGNLKEAAAKLYDVLHELDHLRLDLIVAERLPDKGLGLSMNDRLTRASS